MEKGTYGRFKDYLYFDYQYYLIPRKVLNSNISNNSKLLFVVLHKFRNKKVRNKTLATVAGISKSQVSKSLKELEDNDFITREGRANNRVITPYEDFEKIQAKGDYVRIPAFIVENKELTTNHKVLYFILLDIYFYYINKDLEEVKKVSDLYTEVKSRKNLAERLDYSEDRTSELIRDLAEKYKFKNRYLLATDKAKYYAKYNLYKCNLITPVTKEGFEKLKKDLGVVDNKPDKEEFNIEDELLIEDTPAGEIKEDNNSDVLKQDTLSNRNMKKDTSLIAEDGTRIIKFWDNKFKMNLYKLIDKYNIPTKKQKELKNQFETFSDGELYDLLKSKIGGEIEEYKID